MSISGLVKAVLVKALELRKIYAVAVKTRMICRNLDPEQLKQAVEGLDTTYLNALDQRINPRLIAAYALLSGVKDRKSVCRERV